MGSMGDHVPTYETVARFLVDYRRLRPEQRAAFRAARRLFVEGLERGVFHPALRVKGLQVAAGGLRDVLGAGRPGVVRVRPAAARSGCSGSARCPGVRPRWWPGPGSRPLRRHSMGERPVQLTVNGRQVRHTAEPRLALADFLRERCGLTGTHLGCEHGVCGACTVLVDGLAVRACLMFAVQADGAEVTTAEGIAVDGELSPVQAALRECHGLQCGFCTPGFVISITALLRDIPSPSDEEIREGLSGILPLYRLPGNPRGGAPRRGHQREQRGRLAPPGRAGLPGRVEPGSGRRPHGGRRACPDAGPLSGSAGPVLRAGSPTGRQRAPLRPAPPASPRARRSSRAGSPGRAPGHAPPLRR